MKNQVLSIEQMQKLKELGVDTNKASMVLLFQDDESNIYDWDEVVEECSEFGDCFRHFVKNDEGNHNIVYMSLLDAEDGAYDHSYREDCTVFTLQDIIELLQGTKSFYFRKECENFYLKIEKFSDTNYSISYENSDHFIVGFSGVCLLTCAYNMLVWVAENGYLKTK